MNTKSTIGSDFLSKRIEIQGRPVTLQIWDTAGQERFQSLGVAFYRGSNAIILVYDVTNRSTFDHLEAWRDEFLQQTGVENLPGVVIANKTDLDNRVISYEMGKAFCDRYGMEYFECSAKNDTGIDEAFLSLSSRISLTVKEDYVILDSIESPNEFQRNQGYRYEGSLRFMNDCC